MGRIWFPLRLLVQREFKFLFSFLAMTGGYLWREGGVAWYNSEKGMGRQVMVHFTVAIYIYMVV